MSNIVIQVNEKEIRDKIENLVEQSVTKLTAEHMDKLVNLAIDKKLERVLMRDKVLDKKINKAVVQAIDKAIHERSGNSVNAKYLTVLGHELSYASNEAIRKLVQDTAKDLVFKTLKFELKVDETN